MSENRKKNIIKGTGWFTSPQVEMVKNIIGTDPQGDVLIDHQYINIRFFESGVEGFNPGLDKVQAKEREHVINVLNADTKTIEVMAWEIYMCMAEIFCKHSYLDGVRKWAHKEGFELDPDEEIQFARARWAFEQLKCGNFVEKLPIDVKLLSYLRTYITSDSPKFISLLAKDIAWADDSHIPLNRKKPAAKANDQGLGSKYNDTSSKFNTDRKKASRISSYMNQLCLKSSYDFDECVRSIVNNYGGSEPGLGINPPEYRMEKIKYDAAGNVVGWGKGNFFSLTKSNSAFVKIDDKRSVINYDADTLYRKVKSNIINERKTLFAQFSDQIKEFIIPHWDRYRKSVSVIDRNLEMEIITGLVRSMLEKDKFKMYKKIDKNTEIDIIETLKDTKTFVSYIENIIESREMLSMKERLSRAKLGKLDPKYQLPYEYQKELEEFRSGKTAD